ncbi:adenosylcobinamide amidohydrolase [Plantactinospora sp. GCM10030261]|uniref:adenosylcobinamide amidohydrolase n=1 Tax=Plantactinospora sp. GCM10030261 TaxID=3273420 RepID=UPI0036109DE6
MLPDPVLATRPEGGWDVPLLVWRCARPLLAVSSAPLGGGIGVRHWVLNVTVPMSYDRDDPDRHLAELADGLALRGPGVGHLTGVDVSEAVSATEGGVRLWATVGLGAPIWAASDVPVDDGVSDPVDGAVAPMCRTADPTGRVGTVNVVAHLPVRLGEAALVNAVATAAEAKAQALWELGLAATGTATDSVTLLCPADGPVAAYGGPRSRWGAPLARVVHRAVRAGGAADTVPWSDRIGRAGSGPAGYA